MESRQQLSTFLRVEGLHKLFQMVIAFKVSPFGNLSEPRIKRP